MAKSSAKATDDDSAKVQAKSSEEEPKARRKSLDKALNQIEAGSGDKNSAETHVPLPSKDPKVQKKKRVKAGDQEAESSSKNAGEAEAPLPPNDPKVQKKKRVKAGDQEAVFEAATYGDDPDYLFAFSRRGNFIHLRTYQILEVPNLFTPKKLKLSRLVQHVCFATNSFTTAGLHEVKTSEAVELSEDHVFIGHHTMGTLHSAVLKGSVVRFVLDDLIDLSSWDGFTSILSDFKERNTPILWGRLLGDGDGPDTKISYPNERYKPLIRSLLIETLGLHGKELCFRKISESDVCLSGTRVKLSWGLELLEYDVPIARSNRRDIRALIINMFNGSDLPPDLEALLELLDCENLVPGDYLITHCSLMYDENKGHMINNIYAEFSNLTRRHKFGLEKTPDADPVAGLSSMSVEITYGEDAVADGGNVDTVELMVRGVTKLVTYVRHCNTHLSDQVRTQPLRLEMVRVPDLTGSRPPRWLQPLRLEIKFGLCRILSSTRASTRECLHGCIWD